MSYRSTLLARGDVKGYIELNETTGTVAADNAGAAADGTYAGGYTLNQTPGPLADEAAGWVLLNGTTGRITAPDHADRDLGDTLSITLWFQRTATGGSEQLIIDKGNAGYAVAMNAGGVANKLGVAKSGTAVIVNCNVDIADTNLHMFAWTKAGATNKLYLDGVDVTGTVTNQTLSDTASSLYIGSYNNGTLWFNGKLGRISFHNAAISAADIAAMYAAGRQVSAGNAAAVGTAPGASTSVAPVVGGAAGTAAALNATVVTVQQNAAAATASGSSVAAGPSVSLGVHEFTVFPPGLAANAGLASGTGTALNNTSPPNAPPTVALGIGTARDIGGTLVSPSLVVAPGTGTAYNPAVEISVFGYAETASGTGDVAGAAAPTLAAPHATTAAGVGSAFSPGTSGNSSGNVTHATAGVATAIGRAYNVPPPSLGPQHGRRLRVWRNILLGNGGYDSAWGDLPIFEYWDN